MKHLPWQLHSARQSNWHSSCAAGGEDARGDGNGHEDADGHGEEDGRESEGGQGGQWKIFGGVAGDQSNREENDLAVAGYHCSSDRAGHPHLRPGQPGWRKLRHVSHPMALPLAVGAN